MLSIENDLWRAEFSLHGGQILQCFHKDSPYPVIWLGRKASFAHGTAIRGGSPICWPWFGASPVSGRPIQGFARQNEWQIVSLTKDYVRMMLPECNIPEELRDFPFELSMEILLTDALELSLHTKNTGMKSIHITMALHTYFAVSDCERIRIHGLEKTPFSVKGGPEHVGEKNPLILQGECCRLYYPQTEQIILEDVLWNRRLQISKRNSSSTLIWNPGREREAQIPDLAEDEYRHFVCIEANRAGNDYLEISQGKEAVVSQKITLLKRLH